MDIKELQTTAELARLEFSHDELERARGSFEQMLEWFKIMRDADTFLDLENGNMVSGVPDAAQFRQDCLTGVQDASLAAHMIEKAAEQDGAFIIIPNVL